MRELRPSGCTDPSESRRNPFRSLDVNTSPKSLAGSIARKLYGMSLPDKLPEASSDVSTEQEVERRNISLRTLELRSAMSNLLEAIFTGDSMLRLAENEYGKSLRRLARLKPHMPIGQVETDAFTPDMTQAEEAVAKEFVRIYRTAVTPRNEDPDLWSIFYLTNLYSQGYPAGNFELEEAARIIVALNPVYVHSIRLDVHEMTMRNGDMEPDAVAAQVVDDFQAAKNLLKEYNKIKSSLTEDISSLSPELRRLIQIKEANSRPSLSDFELSMEVMKERRLQTTSAPVVRVTADGTMPNLREATTGKTHGSEQLEAALDAHFPRVRTSSDLRNAEIRSVARVIEDLFRTTDSASISADAIEYQRAFEALARDSSPQAIVEQARIIVDARNELRRSHDVMERAEDGA